MSNRAIAKHLPLADHIIILGEDGEIAEERRWDDPRAGAGYISQIVLEEDHYKLQKSNDRPEASVMMPIESSAELKSDSSMQDLARKAGDIMLYSMYFHVRTRCIVDIS